LNNLIAALLGFSNQALKIYGKHLDTSVLKKYKKLQFTLWEQGNLPVLERDMALYDNTSKELTLMVNELKLVMESNEKN
jgi:hypothetical protein